MNQACLLLCSLTLGLGCTPKPEAGLPDTGCDWPGPKSDSALLDNFQRFFKIRNAPAPFIPQSDTIYRFSGRGGWGVFDYLCSVYYDTTGYKVSVSTLACPNLDGRCDFEEKTRSIGFFEWQQIRSEFQKGDFWCDSLDYNGNTCTDDHEYSLIAREGGKFREVKWGDCESGLKSMKVISKKVRDLCGLPSAPGCASYTIKGDSIFANIFIGHQLGSFTEKIDFQYHGSVFPASEGILEMTLHKRDLDSLRRIIITEYGIDGSRRSVNITRLIAH